MCTTHGTKGQLQVRWVRLPYWQLYIQMVSFFILIKETRAGPQHLSKSISTRYPYQDIVQVHTVNVALEFQINAGRERLPSSSLGFDSHCLLASVTFLCHFDSSQYPFPTAILNQDFRQHDKWQLVNRSWLAVAFQLALQYHMRDEETSRSFSGFDSHTRRSSAARKSFYLGQLVDPPRF